MNLERILGKIESEDPASGIGTAAAATGILAASLVIKVANKSKLEELQKEAEETKQELIKLIKKDAKAYKNVIKAYKSKEEKKINKAMKQATETPMKIAEQSYKVMELAEIALEKGKKSMVLEAYGAVVNGRAAVESATEIAEVNLRELKDKEYNRKIRPRKYNLLVMARQKEKEVIIKAAPYIYSSE